MQKLLLYFEWNPASFSFDAVMTVVFTAYSGDSTSIWTYLIINNLSVGQ